MNFKLITSANNKTIKLINKLKKSNYRREFNLYLIEGYKLLQEAINNNIHLQEIIIYKQNLYKEKYKNFIASLKQKDIKITLIDYNIFKKISTLLNPEGFLAVAKTKEKQLNILDKNYILVLDNINNPGNLGNIIRTSIAFNIDTILINSNSVDIYNEKVIRASAGAFFKINILETNNLYEFIKKLKRNQFKIIATTAHKGIKLSQYNFNEKKIAFIFGNEHSGISKELLNLSDINLQIETTNYLESLNLSNSVSIILYNLYIKKLKYF